MLVVTHSMFIYIVEWYGGSKYCTKDGGRRSEDRGQGMDRAA